MKSWLLISQLIVTVSIFNPCYPVDCEDSCDQYCETEGSFFCGTVCMAGCSDPTCGNRVNYCTSTYPNANSLCQTIYNQGCIIAGCTTCLPSKEKEKYWR